MKMKQKQTVRVLTAALAMALAVPSIGFAATIDIIKNISTQQLWSAPYQVTFYLYDAQDAVMPIASQTFDASQWLTAEEYYAGKAMRVSAQITETQGVDTEAPLWVETFVDGENIGPRELIGLPIDLSIENYFKFRNVSSGLIFQDGSVQTTAGITSETDPNLADHEGDASAHHTKVTPGGIDMSIQFNDNGSLNGEDIFIWDKTNNRLGIGTASPINGLHLYDVNNEGDIYIENTFPFITLDALSLTGNAGMIFKEQGEPKGILAYNHNVDALYISAANSSSMISHIVVETAGDVGIGTATPDRKLTVNGTVGINDYIYHNADDDTKIYMLSDGIEFTAGNEKLIDLFEGSQDLVKLGDGGDVDINLNDDLFVQGSNGNVGIGTMTPSKILHVRDSNTSGGEGVIHSEFTGTTTTDAVAVYGNSTPTDGYGVGGKFYGGYYAVEAIAEPGATYNSSTYGVHATNSGSNSGSKYGVRGYANGETGNTGTLYAVYGYAGGVGDTKYAGYFSGNLHYTGTLSGPSDRKLKSNNRPLTSTLSKVNDIKIYSYNYKEIEGMALPKGNKFGFIAQELETLYPELVTDNVHIIESKDKKSASETIEYKGVNYIGMIPILTKAIQEQQTIIEKQQQQINELIIQMEEFKEIIVTGDWLGPL